MKYTIITGSTLIELDSRVNEQIKLGYEPQGGIEVKTRPGGEFFYFQAMIKDEEFISNDKLEALERLRNKGFKFNGFAYTELNDFAKINIKATVINDCINEDLELLFGDTNGA